MSLFDAQPTRPTVKVVAPLLNDPFGGRSIPELLGLLHGWQKVWDGRLPEGSRWVREVRAELDRRTAA